MEGVCFGFRAPPDGEAHVRCSRSQLTKRRSELLHAGCAQHFFLHLCWRCTDPVCSQLLYAGENFPIVCRLIPGTWCAGLTAALPCLECSGEWHRSTCAGHFRFLVSSRCKPDCGDQAPILCMSAYSQKLACAFAYQSGRQRSGRWNCLRRQAQHSWQRSFTAVCRCFQTEQKHPRISASGGVFYRGL